MPTIRDLVAAIRQRDGVDAAIVLGHDGLVIEAQLSPELTADDLAARVPGIVGPASDFGFTHGRGDLLTAVLEHRDGFAIVSVLSVDAILLVLVAPGANTGQLLYELRRNREEIAALI
ncbi:MAG TPA: roadblock/LC7 domain-containing protein [Gemmatimonadaceae bacterium]|jgi:hypothetical protein|nr:roadblock/LC7 domain-containing protein [Gemmatimonadaceae bacterium]